ncbi:MAG TPA: hypothetical protein VE978_01875 [Chitinophagales bacterium]|nr:hypothetical protein [Chitinophagales bacterium]
MKNYFQYWLSFIALFCCLSPKTSAQSSQFGVAVCYGYFYNDIILRTISSDLTYQAGPIYCKLEFRDKDPRLSYQLSLLYFNADWERLGSKRVYQDSMWTYIPAALKNHVDGYSFVFKANCYVVSTKKFDGFVSIGGGFQIINWKLDPDYPPCYGEDCEYGFPWALKYRFPLVIEATMGMRYRIIPHLALYCETGYSKASLQLGLSGQF